MGLDGGVLQLQDFKINLPMIAAFLTIVGYSLNDTIVVFDRIREVRGKNPSLTPEMVNLSLNQTLSRTLLTSVTTAIGFLSLNFSDSPPFRDLGNISAMGVMFAWLFSTTLLPAMVTLLPAKPQQRRAYVSELMTHFADWVINHRKILMPTVGLVIVGLALVIPRNELNDVFVRYFDESIEFRPHTDFVVDNLTGMYFIDYSLDSGESGGISDPTYLAKIERFGNWLSEQPEVVHVSTLTDVFKRVNRSMHGDDARWHRLPEQRDMAAQYLLLYEMSLPYGLDLNNQIDVDKRRTRLSATLETLSTSQTLAFEQRTYDWMRNNTPALLTTAASPPIMFSHIGMRNIVSMLGGTAFALIAISLLMIIALGSWRYGLLTLIPNIAPAAMAFGLWALIDGEVGLGLSVVAAMTLGIVVDDTIHFMSKYLRARRQQGLDAIAAVRYSFATVGVALWTTTMALAAGFLVISTSAFAVNAEMGLLVAIVVVLALVVDFLLLPGLLIRFDKSLIGPSPNKTTVEAARQGA